MRKGGAFETGYDEVGEDRGAFERQRRRGRRIRPVCGGRGPERRHLAGREAGLVVASGQEP